MEEVGRATKKKISKVGRSADGKRNVVVAGSETDADFADFAGYPFRPGDRVMGVTRFGAYASHLNIGTSFIRKIPDDWCRPSTIYRTCLQAMSAGRALAQYTIFGRCNVGTCTPAPVHSVFPMACPVWGWQVLCAGRCLRRSGALFHCYLYDSP